MRIRLLLVLAVSLVACSSASTGGGTVRVEDRPLPELTGQGIHGERLSSGDHKGHVLVVSVWATWCYDCERDQPGFVNVAQRYAGDGVRFLGVDSLETSTAQPSAWVRRYRVPYPSIQDPSGRFAASLGYTGLPATYVVDPTGTVRYSIIGSTTSEATLSGLIDQVLAGGSATPSTAPSSASSTSS
jgi:thiol-disulfide isomerase/thioredoxin